MRHSYVDSTRRVLVDIRDERERQNHKFGEQSLPDGTGQESDEAIADIAKSICAAATEAGTVTWMQVLTEEVFEAFAEKDLKKLRTELVQVAAVATAWVEHIDRREEPPDTAPAPPGYPGDRPS